MRRSQGFSEGGLMMYGWASTNPFFSGKKLSSTAWACSITIGYLYIQRLAPSRLSSPLIFIKRSEYHSTIMAAWLLLARRFNGLDFGHCLAQLTHHQRLQPTQLFIYLYS